MSVLAAQCPAVSSTERAAVQWPFNSAHLAAIKTALDAAVKQAIRQAVFAAVGRAQSPACWRSFDSAVGAAERDTEQLVFVAADGFTFSAAFLAALAAPFCCPEFTAVCASVVSAIGAALNGSF